jgi:hypothetical protein
MIQHGDGVEATRAKLSVPLITLPDAVKHINIPIQIQNFGLIKVLYYNNKKI